MNIDLALSAKKGNVEAINQLHSYYVNQLYAYSNIINVDQLVDNIRIGNTSDYLDAFIYLTSFVCQGNKGSQNDLDYLYSKIDKIILLPNFTGHFTFDDYLKVHYAGYELIGIPVDKSNYDNIVNGCPIDFISHDASHLRYVIGNQQISEYLRPIYLNVISQNNYDRDLMLIIIWMYIHENGLKDAFYRKVHPFAFRDKLNALMNSIGEHLKSYQNILLTEDNVENTLKNLANYIKHYTKEYFTLKKYSLGKIEDIDDNNVFFLLGLNYGYNKIF